MRILFVHERFGALAGAEANLFITATEFKKREHSVAILHGESTGKNEAGWLNTFSRRYALKEEDNPSIVEAALRDFAPDVVYVHKMADLDVIEPLVKSGLPLVRMVHDHDIYCMRSYKYFYFSRKICTRAAGLHCLFSCGAFIAKNHGAGFPLKYQSYSEKRREIELNKAFDRMVVVTHYMRDELLGNGFAEERIEIHAPVPHMAEADFTSNFSDRNLIIFAGQIIRGKGVDILLESLALVQTPFECIILGAGSHRAYCEKLCRKLRLQDRVQFRGFIPQEELKTYYRECSVFAISSVWPEPFATVGVEVMRYAIPVVAFDAGGIRDWLHDGFNGYLVPWMDREAYANRLDRLLQDKALARQMGENGREVVNQRYDFSKYIDELEAMFVRVTTARETNKSLLNKSADLLRIA
ncbi:MAG: glycosyltransferase family 4 protein [Verrucomicrobia bacterium]|nr:glycosyltransferase family 4 protein [Verrucomicrobiota bacterium]